MHKYFLYPFFLKINSLLHGAHRQTVAERQYLLIITNKGKKSKQEPEEEKQRGKIWLHIYSLEPRRMECSTIVKTEGSGIVIKKVDKTIDDDIAWPCGGVM